MADAAEMEHLTAFVDRAGRMWYCRVMGRRKKGAVGTPMVSKQLSPRKRNRNTVPRAGKLKITKADGTVEERPAMNPWQVQKIIGNKKSK